MRALGCLALIAAALAGGCRIPGDPEGTLARAEGGAMRVGVTEADPWVELGPDGRPTGGVEVELVRRFGRDIGARVAWVDGGEEELVSAMKEGSLDLLIGGLTDKSRWEKDVALTRPYLDTRSVVGMPEGRPLSDELDGMSVVAELGTEEEGLLARKTGAEAARRGENAFLVRLERFLQNREPRHDSREFHPIVERMTEELAKCDWVEDAAVRLREEGHVFTGEVLLVPATEENLLERLDDLAGHLRSLEWKLYDIVVVPVREIDIPTPDGDGDRRRHIERFVPVSPAGADQADHGKGGQRA
jgi:polar amino acid transport system substrate-binding protein